MTENIKISVNILPFGQTKLSFNSTEGKLKKREKPIYVEQRSTNIKRIAIFYEDSLKEYKISKTTDGI